MADFATAITSLHTINSAHISVKFTMEVEKNGKFPVLGTELLNRAPRIETKVYVKPRVYKHGSTITLSKQCRQSLLTNGAY